MIHDIVRKVQALREGGHTQRLHTVPVHLDASVAKHSWNMAVLLNTLWPDAPKHLIMACLLHDVSERWIGDTPAPAKYSIHPPLAKALHAAESKVEDALGIMQVELTREEQAWLKGIDILELVMHAEDEINLGNNHLDVTLRNAQAILDDEWVPEPIREFARAYRWQRTSDLVEGNTMEKLTHDQHTER